MCRNGKYYAGEDQWINCPRCWCDECEHRPCRCEEHKRMLEACKKAKEQGKGYLVESIVADFYFKR